MKIDLDYCSIHESVDFIMLLSIDCVKILEVDMLSSDYNGGCLCIIILIKGYQFVTMTSRWQLWQYLWTVGNSTYKVYD